MATKLLVCLVVMAGVSAVPLNTRDDFENESVYQCSQQCKADPTKFNYQPSNTFVYEYKAEAETSMVGASEEKARIQIETHANIEVISKCEFALRLQNVKIHHSEPYSDSLKPAKQTQEFQRELTTNTLRFSFDDGIIRDICHPSQEKTWVLNFKRGLLSAFQNSMVDFTRSHKVSEIDVTGECVAEYNKTKEWPWDSSIKVTKSKNLIACYKHIGWRTIVQMVPYQIPSDIQSIPLVKSSHQCEYVISSSGILKSTSCKEIHISAPFSNHQSGGVTKIDQTLTFKAVKRGIETRLDNIESRSSLLFHHVNGIDEVKKSREAAEQKLKEICEQAKDNVRPETPRLFSELVQIVKVLEGNEINSLFKKIKSKRLCSENDKAMKFLLDTLPIAGSPGAVEFMATVINVYKGINNVDKQVWLTSLSLIPKPSEEMLPSLLKLVSGKSADQALLPVSTLLHTLCEKKVNCDRSFQFRKIVKRIDRNINSCQSHDRTQVMKTLRSIGNIGHGKSFLTSLKNCLKSHTAPLEYKVAAAEAYRRFPCQQDEENGPLFQTFEDQNADPEVRIISFLSLMRCPRDSILEKIAAQLEKEDDINVGTFVYTHLENIKKTSDPHSQDIAEAVKRLNLRKIQDGGLKTSRSFAHSALLNRLNLGYVADANLIWSPSSVAPRAAKVNLTLALFGQSVNVFEGGIRVDGLENFVKKYFGADGYFPEDKTSKDDLEAFIYARVFGNELFFHHVKGSKDLEDIKSRFSLDKIVDNLSKKFDYKYSTSHELLDQSVIIPTVIGLPVNLTVNSSVTVDARLKGKFDFNGILSRSKPISILADGAASAALEVTGSMMVDAFIYKHGLRMRGTLHSSVNFKSNMIVKDRQIINFEIDSPQEKQELFDARSQIFIIHDNFENEQDMIKENRKELNYCTDDKVTKVTGLELCGVVQYANASLKEDAPYFPYTGPSRVSLVLNKKDTQRSYKIFAKWIKNSKKLEAQLQLDTPGSEVNRHISVDVTIGVHDIKHVDVVLISPWKKVLINGKAAKNNDMASLTGSVVIDDKDNYKLTSEVKMNRNGKRHQYLPFVEIENLDNRITLLAGSVIHNEDKDISADLQIKDLKENSYVHSGQLSYNKQEKRLVVLIGEKDKQPYQIRIGTSIKKSGKKNKNIQLDPEVLIQTPRGVIASLQSEMEYQSKPLKVIGNMRLKTIRMKRPFTLNVDLKQKRNSYPVTVKMSSPILTGQVKGKIVVNKNRYFSSRMNANYKTSSMKGTVIWHAKLRNQSKNALIWYTANSVLNFPDMPDYTSESNLVLTHKKESTASLTIKYGKKSAKKLIEVVTSANVNVKNVKEAQITASLKAKMPEKNVDIKMELDHTHNKKELSSEMKVHLAPWLENDINADVNIQNKGSKSLYLITGNGRLNVMGQRYDLRSDLTQKQKTRYLHTVTVSLGKDRKYKLISNYKKAKDVHELTTNIESTQLDIPLKFSVSGNVKSPFDFSVKGSLNENKNKLYAVNALSKFEEGVAGKWNLELVHPVRKVKANAYFNKEKDRVKTVALINWDVDSDEKVAPQIEVTSFFTVKSMPKNILVKSNVKVKTPFKNWRLLTSIMNFEKTKSDLKSTGRLSWGGIHKQISSEVSAKLPITLEKTKISFQAKTPFKNFKDVELEVDHILDSDIKTTVKGKMDDNELKLNGMVKNNKDLSKTTLFEGDLTLITSHPKARQTVVKTKVTNSKGMNYFVEVDKDGKKYSANLNQEAYFDKELSLGYKLDLEGPGQTADALLSLRSKKERHSIDFMVNTFNNRKKKTSVSVNGFYHDEHNMKLDVDVKSPFSSFKRVGLEFDHRVEEKELKSKIILKKNRAKTGYDIKLSDKRSELSANVLLLLSPAYEKDVSLVSVVQYELYPVTVSTQIRWAPSSVIDFSGSYKIENKDDMQISLKLTTPFEDLENINVIASHVLDKSVRVSHLNIDYAVKKTIDIEILSQNEELNKMARIKIDAPCPYFNHIDTGVRVDLKKGIDSRFDLELELDTNEKYDCFVSLNENENEIVNGNVKIRTSIEGFKEIKGSAKYNPNDNKESFLKLTKEKEDLIDVIIDKKWKKDKFNIEITTKGKIIDMLTGNYDDFVIIQSPGNFVDYIVFQTISTLHDAGFFPKHIQKDEKGNLLKQIIIQFNMEQEVETTEVGSSILFDYGLSQNKIGFRVRKAGEEMNNMDIDISVIGDNETMTGKLELKLIDDIKIQALVQDIFGKLHGIKFSLSEKSDKLEIEGKVYLSELRNFESGFYFLMSDLNHVELTTTTKSGVRGYELTSIKYRHEGQDNRVSCSFTVDDINGPVGSIDLVAECSPIYLFSLTVKSPHKDYKEMIISGNYDETSLTGLVKVMEDKKISISGAHNNFKNTRLTLKTPFKPLQELSINVDGNLSDGSSKFTLRFNDNNQIGGNIAVKYEDLSQMSVSSGLSSRIDESEKSIKLEMETSSKPRKNFFLLALNNKDQVKLNTEWEHEETEKAKILLDVELQYPSLGIQTNGLILSLDGNIEKALGKIQLLNESGKMLDADLNFDMEGDTKAYVIVRQPKMMEYKFTQEHFAESNENELSFNWDRTDPEANLVVKTVVRDDSNSYKTDKTISLKLSCPRRSIGLEHSIVVTKVKVQSSGKVFWNDGRKSQVAYEMEVNDQSNRRKNLYDGELKIQLPTRTIGIFGSTRDMMSERQVESAISWDLDNDSSKKIGIKAKVLKGDHTQADVSLILPQDAHVDSKLVLNKGNTILEGQTKIFYSDDSSKTLTLFSKVENRPETSYFYSGNKLNYSIQVGVSHPDSRIDVKLNSHWGMDDERLTTSLGLDYLNSRRQNQNMDLFLEINKVKREVNLISANPYKNFGWTSTINKDPFEARVAATLDDQDFFERYLLIDSKNKKVVYNFSSFGRGLSLSAHILNETALQMDMRRLENDESEQFIRTVFQLTNPDTLQSSLEWKPGTLKEIRDIFFQNLKQGFTHWKEVVDSIAQDMKTEVARKYADVTSSVYEDIKPLVEFMEEEITSVEKDLDQLQKNMRSNFGFCGVKIGDIDLDEQLTKLQKKLKDFVKDMNEVIQSYTKAYKDALGGLLDKLQAMKNYPVNDVVPKIINELVQLERKLFRTDFLKISEELHFITDEQFKDFWEFVDRFVEKVLDPQPFIKDLNERMEKIMKKQMSWHVGNILRNNKQIASQIKTLVNEIRESVVNHPLTDKTRVALENSGGEVYQQVKWAYNYWRVEENLPKQFDSLVDLINEVVEEELKEQQRSLYHIIGNPVTQFDAEQGLLVVEIPLPVTLDRLDQVPDVGKLSSQLVASMENQLGSPNQAILTEVILAQFVIDPKTLFIFTVILN